MATGDGRTKPERLSWTPHEDGTILSSVGELGHKWNKIALRLPGRTEHAIRNRYHRLQTSVADRRGPPPQSQSLQGLQSQGLPRANAQPPKHARAGAAAARAAHGDATHLVGMRKVAAADLAAELNIELAAEIVLGAEISLPPLSPTAAFRLHCI